RRISTVLLSRGRRLLCSFCPSTLSRAFSFLQGLPLRCVVQVPIGGRRDREPCRNGRPRIDLAMAFPPWLRPSPPDRTPNPRYRCIGQWSCWCSELGQERWPCRET